jgi:S-DNA-T family DNA segregation ATPase FtsK/SpoIIIE
VRSPAWTTSPGSTRSPWRIPVGLRESDLEPGLAELYEGEHLLVAGPARSGKSTALLAMAEALRARAALDGTGLRIWGVCGRRSPLRSASLDGIAVGEDQIAGLLARARLCTGPSVLLIDDAETFPDSDQAITGLLDAGLTNLHVLAAGRADDLRSAYGHWTGAVRKSRCGILLQPSVDYDGELLGAALPRRSPVALTAGRGYLCVGGSVDLVQCASPSDDGGGIGGAGLPGAAGAPVSSGSGGRP